jgi:putative holliday junction resolvase
MKMLGIDFGLRKVGLALGDSGSRVSVPLEVIQNDDRLLVRLAELVRDEGIDEIVVGVPLPVGEQTGSKQLDVTRAFIEDVRRVVSVPIHESDERHTSFMSQQLRKEEGSRVQEDALAAMMILQSYLDAM